MNKRISKIPNNVQDRNSIAQKKLCEYIDKIAKNGDKEFTLWLLCYDKTLQVSL